MNRTQVVLISILSVTLLLAGCTQPSDSGGDDGTNGGSSEATYNGHERNCWLYTGTEVSLYRDWQDGDVSTDTFQTDTSRGDGTASLVLSADCGGDSLMYNGKPRVCYSYSGNEPSEYEEWKSGDQSTDSFQTNTGQGEGTSSLSLKDGCK